jgi:phage tail-like protein
LLDAGYKNLIGLDFSKALRILEDSEDSVVAHFYQESSQPRFTVLDVKTVQNKEGKNDLTFYLAGKNPIEYLPSIYQDNSFLKNFLWIFQHIQYEQIQTLDSLHNYFIPNEAPKEFLNWMADWFGMDLNKNFYDEKTVRELLQKGLSLFQWRGTVKGLKEYLRIIMGVTPEIIENSFPQTDFVILGDKQVTNVIRNHSESQIPFFTVHFPVDISFFNQVDKGRIASIVEQEKPAHTMYYITFEKKKIKKRNGILISDDKIFI